MEKMTKEQVIKELDRLNDKEFKYFGVWHIRSGCKTEVKIHQNFIEQLNAKPIREIKIYDPQIIGTSFIVIEFSPAYVNIYDITDIKNKIEGLSKHKCMVRLNVEDS